MKTRVGMALLVALNLGLAGGLVFVLTDRREAPPRVVVRYVTNETVQVVTRPVTVLTNQSAAPSKIWQGVESSDYRVYIANLRAIGCPEETIRDIIIADVNKLYAQRQRALDPARKQTNTAWWVAPVYNAAEQREYAQQTRALQREKRELVKSLLGVDLNQELLRQQGYGSYQEQQLAFLPADKRSQVQSILDKYSELETGVYDRAGDLSQAERQALLKQYRAQRSAEIAAALTPAEFEQYELRTSATAQTLRYQMSAFDATEAEFRTIYQLQKAFDDQVSAFQYDAANSTRYTQERQAAQKKLDDGLKAALGEARYAEYKRAQDYNYRAVYEVVRSCQLPKEAAIAVYELQKDVEAQRRQILATQGWSAEQRKAALAALADQAEQSVRNVLGPEGFKEYKNRGGYWIQGLAGGYVGGNR